MSRSPAADPELTRFLDAWFAVRQLIQAANFNRFQSAGLSATQFMTLNLLPAVRGSIRMGDLAREMNLKPATVARTVDSLEARALLTRTRSLTDRREILVTITPAGARLQNAAAGQFRRHMRRLFRAMSATERVHLLDGLESLVRAAEPASVRRVAPRARRSSPQSPPA